MYKFCFERSVTAALTAALLCVCCMLMAGCNSSASSNETSVAATIMGQDITEQEVTDYIDSFRQGISCQDDSDWASYLAGYDMTASDFRLTTIYELAAPIVIKNKADELGIEADESEVDTVIENLKSSLMVESDEDWQETLEKYGTTEEKTRETYRNQNLRTKVLKEVIGNIDPTKTDVKNYVESNLLGSTEKFVEVVYGPDYATLQADLRKVQKASSNRAGMTKLEKSADDKTISAEKLGWSDFADLSDNVTDTIEDMSKGDVYDSLVADEGVYVIVYVSDVYKFPKKIKDFKASSMPKSLRKKVEKAASEDLESSAGSVWVKTQIEENITVNDMPSGLSYDVSTDGQQQAGNTASNASVEENTSAEEKSGN